MNYMSPEAIQRMNNQKVLKVNIEMSSAEKLSCPTRATFGPWAVSYIRWCTEIHHLRKLAAVPCRR